MLVNKGKVPYIILCLSLVSIALVFRLSKIDDWLPIFVDEGAISLKATNVWLTQQVFSFHAWQNEGLTVVYSLLFSIFGDCNLVYARSFQAICGVISIFVSFQIFKMMYGIRVGFIAALLLSIMPYHVFFSRLALFYSFQLLVFLIIVFLTLKFKTSSEVMKMFIVILLFIITALNLQLDSGQLIMSVPFLFSLFIVYICQELRNKKKILNRKLLIILLVVIAITLLLLCELGSLQHRIGNILTATSEKGWEGLFGWDNWNSVLWSADWIITYIAILVTPPIFILSILGMFIVVRKKGYRIILIAWLVAVIVAVWIGGYYPRRLIHITPLTALFAALSIDTIYLKMSSRGIKNLVKFKVAIIKWQKTVPINSVILIGLVAIVAVWPAYQSYEYVTNFECLKPPTVPTVIRNIYVDYWMSGFRVEDAADFIIKNIPQNSIILVDMDLPYHLQFLLVKYNYTIMPIDQAGNGNRWNASIYENILEDDRFRGSYFLFTDPFFIDWSATVDLPWIKIGENSHNDPYVNRNFVIYKTLSGIPLKDTSFKELTALEENATAVWKKYVVAFGDNYSLDISRASGGLRFTYEGHDPSWMSLSLIQNLNSKWSSLRALPMLKVDVDILEQEPESTFIIDIGLIHNGSLKEMIFFYANKKATFGDWNSTSAVYYINSVSLGENLLSINISQYFEDYFGKMGEISNEFGIKFIAVGGGSRCGRTIFVLKNIDLTYFGP
jgi:hypothetical protein